MSKNAVISKPKSLIEKKLAVCAPVLNAYLKPLAEDKEMKARVGDLLLQYLSQHVVLPDKKEGLGVFALIQKINKALDHNEELVLSVGEHERLKGLVQINQIYDMQTGKVVDFWLPYVWAQIVEVVNAAL